MINFDGLSDIITRQALKGLAGIKYEIRDQAPSSIIEVRQAFASTGRLIVYSGASDATIYGASETNYLFRAWHDLLHVRIQAGFDLQGEIRVAMEHCRLVQSDTLSAIIKAEVIGQAEHFFSTGIFPQNQVEFIKSYLGGVR